MADDPRTDSELVDAVRGGDGGAFAALYLRHRDRAFRVARRYAPDDGPAMDAVQEALLYLHRKGRGLRPTARFTTFLYPVVRHEAQRAARNARRGQGPTSPERQLGVCIPPVRLARSEER
ncbi:MAG: sigma-70 family RNA polymerase sigma factor [Phycisphaerales bacterium]|nr:sigma-70 family RNA polymerase sigma factor [Phycisphaerales bacterium]